MQIQEDISALIRSLSKSEKRYFKLFVGKNSIGESSNYIKLFDLIEKAGTAERKVIQKLCPDEYFIQKQYNTCKYRLYDQILKSLRSFHSEQSVDDKIMELIRNAKILYDKALYADAEKILIKAKSIALKHEKHPQLLEIIRWQKKIVMSFSILRKISKTEIDELVEEEKSVTKKIDNANIYWNAFALIYLSYRIHGEARTDEDMERYNVIINEPFLKNENLALSYQAQINFYSSHAHYAIAANNLKTYYEKTKKLLAIMEAQPHQLKDDIVKYINILHNLLYATQRLNKYKEFFYLLPKLKSMLNKSNSGMSESIRSKILSYAYHLEFNAFLATGNFLKAEQLLMEIEAAKEQKNKFEITELYITLNKSFLYFGKRDYNKALACVNALINLEKNSSFTLQEDYSFLRIFQLIIHFEKGNMDLLPYMVKSVYRYLMLQKRLHKFENIVIRFIRTKLYKINTADDQLEAFKALKDELEEVCKDPMEAKFLDFFDVISWLESKIENRTFGEVLREKSGYA